MEEEYIYEVLKDFDYNLPTRKGIIILPFKKGSPFVAKNPNGEYVRKLIEEKKIKFSRNLIGLNE